MSESGQYGRLSGVIVAGGRSRRFGAQDKALASVDGTPMIRRVADRLAPVTDELVINCRADQRDAIDAVLDGTAHSPRFAVDPVPDRGPVFGLRTGLRAATGDYAAVLACDRPFVTPHLVTRLFLRAVGDSAAVPRLDGYRQPLCAAYRVPDGVAACTATIDAGSARLQDVLDRLDPRIVPESVLRMRGWEDALRNINRPSDNSTPR